MKQSTAIAIIAITLVFTAAMTAGCGPGGVKQRAETPPSGDVNRPAGNIVRLPGNIAGLNFPTDLAITDDGNIYFTEKTGALRLISNGRLQNRPVAVIKVPNIVGYNETGLLGIALSPGFNRDHLIYLYHTYEKGGHSYEPKRLFNRIIRLDARRPAQRRIIYDNILGERIHNGGKLRFGPDGKLYVSVGETNRQQLSRSKTAPNGKILRLEPDGAIPADNPFKGSPVFAYGIRNVFGLTFDNKGRLFATENGQEVDDEIDLIKRGADYGWPIETGRGSGRFEPPLITYRITIAPTGIVYYDKSLIKKWRGKLIFGDWNGGRLHALTLKGGSASDQIVGSLSEGITALAVAPDGALYAVTESELRRITN